MVIKASVSAEVRQLVDGLGSTDEVRLEAAIARLGIIGPRAVPRLLDAYGAQSSRTSRRAILRTLETIGDPRALSLARQALQEGGDVAVAAVGLMRSLLDQPQGTAAADALDALAGLALDVHAERRPRLAAIDALRNLSEPVRAPLVEALRRDPDGLLHDRARSGSDQAAAEDALWADAVEGRLPDDPETLREVLAPRAAAAPLNTLRKLVDAIRTVETDPAAAGRRQAWLALRGTIHQALALRGSRVALYDLRETVEAASARLPISFLAAVHVLGDRTFLEPLAAAHDRAPAADGWWRAQVAGAFRAITRRERITKRDSTLKRIASRWPDLTGC